MENNNFEKWYASILETTSVPKTKEVKSHDTSEDTTLTADTISPAPAETSKAEIISDVDSIMNSLSQLSVQIKEEIKTIEQEYGFQILDESDELMVEAESDELISEGFGDMSAFNSIFQDPLFQLAGLGIVAVAGAIGLTVSEIRAANKNKKLAKMLIGDYTKLTSMKKEEIKLDAIIQKLEERKSEIKGETGSSDDENGRNRTSNEPSDNKTKALKIMIGRVNAQIDTLNKKKISLGDGISQFQQALDKKYALENISGFGARKVKKMLEVAQDNMSQEISTLKLKLMSGSMNAEEAEKLKERIKNLDKRSNERQVEIEKEVEKNTRKAEEIAKKDEETRKALEEINRRKQEREDKKNKAKTNRDGKGEPTPGQSNDGGKGEPASGQSSTGETNALTQIEADIKQYNKNISDERVSIEKAKKELKTETEPEKIAKLKDSIKQSNEDIKSMLDDVEKLKARLSPQESLLYNAIELGLNEMAIEIASKQAWQFENNSALFIKYNTEIIKQSSINKLNESRYNNMSISDNFKTLLS